MNKVTGDEVLKWFKAVTPKRWPMPGNEDAADIAEVINLYCGVGEGGEEEGEPSLIDEPRKRGKKTEIRDAFKTVSRNARGIGRLARARLSQAVRDGLPVGYSMDDVLILEALPTSAERIFAELMPERRNQRQEWHGTAKLLAKQAADAWKAAGCSSVGLGNKPTSPVVIFVQSALLRIGEVHEADAIVAALQTWQKDTR